jgi:hypothetical protein
MDFSRTKLCPKPLLSPSSIFPNVQFSKTTGWFKRSWNWSTCPLTKCYSKAHAFLYTLMDFFQSHQTVPKPLLSYLLPFPERSIALVTTGWFKRSWNWSNLPHANKVLLQGSTRILIWMDFFQSHHVPKPLLSYLLPFSRTFNCTSKTTGWFTKEAEIDPNLLTLTKCYSKVAHAFLYDGLLSVAQTVPKPLLSYLLPFSERSIALSKTTGWFTKRAEIPTCPLTKCYSKVAHAFLYTLIFFQSHQTVPKPLLSYLLPFPERSIALVKRLAGSPKGWNWSNHLTLTCYSR